MKERENSYSHHLFFFMLKTLNPKSLYQKPSTLNSLFMDASAAALSRIGLAGLAVMGQNLALNIVEGILAVLSSFHLYLSVSLSLQISGEEQQSARNLNPPLAILSPKNKPPPILTRLVSLGKWCVTHCI